MEFKKVYRLFHRIDVLILEHLLGRTPLDLNIYQVLGVCIMSPTYWNLYYCIRMEDAGVRVKVIIRIILILNYSYNKLMGYTKGESKNVSTQMQLISL